LVFDNESLKSAEDKKKEERLTVGQEAVKTHETAEKKKNFLNAKKNPLLNTSLDIQSPDEQVNQATENRENGISAVLKGEDHKKVSALIMGNIPQQAGEKIAGSIMNDYS